MAFESVFAMHAGARHLYRDQRDVETGNNGKMARRRRHRRGSAAESREKVHFHNRVKYFAVRLFQKSRGGLKNARARARARAWCLLRRCGKKKKREKEKRKKKKKKKKNRRYLLLNVVKKIIGSARAGTFLSLAVGEILSSVLRFSVPPFSSSLIPRAGL